MMKPSKTERLRRNIHARVQFYGLDELRQFFAAAAKFLIARENWDDSHPITGFDNDSVIRAFHEGFGQFTKADMLGAKQLTETEATFIRLLRDAAGWSGTDLNFRIAKRKLTRLRQLMQRFLRSSRHHEQPLRGLRFYDKAIRNKYLATTKRRAEMRSHTPKTDAA
jgi:hypothetical protein